MDKVSRFTSANRKNLDLYFSYCRNISRGKDLVHSIHQLRVVSRRLANYFWVLKHFVPANDYDVAYKSFRRIIRSLGKARDLDVQMGILKDSHPKKLPKKEDASLKKVQQVISKKRDSLSDDVKQEIKVSLQHRFPKRIKKILVHLNKKLKSLGSSKIRDYGKKRIIKRLHALLGFEYYVNRPEASKDLHRLRIQAKRLRFTLETLAPFYDHQYDLLTAFAAGVQKQLGAFHDHEEWVAFLEEKKSKTRNTAQRRFISRLLEHSKSQKMKCYREFVKIWKSASHKRIFDSVLYKK